MPGVPGQLDIAMQGMPRAATSFEVALNRYRERLQDNGLSTRIAQGRRSLAVARKRLVSGSSDGSGSELQI